MNPMLHINYQGDFKMIPDETAFKDFAAAALSVAKRQTAAEISLTLMDATDMQALNLAYRDKDKPTNVLSFPADLPDMLDLPLLGDLILCHPVIVKEAREQGKTLEAHYAHMTIHGTLHLLGYDHIEKTDADIMEGLEIQALSRLGYANPYDDYSYEPTQPKQVKTHS